MFHERHMFDIIRFISNLSRCVVCVQRLIQCCVTFVGTVIYLFIYPYISGFFVFADVRLLFIKYLPKFTVYSIKLRAFVCIQHCLLNYLSIKKNFSRKSFLNVCNLSFFFSIEKNIPKSTV